MGFTKRINPFSQKKREGTLTKGEKKKRRRKFELSVLRLGRPWGRNHKEGILGFGRRLVGGGRGFGVMRISF